MEAIAIHKFARLSAQKGRLVADQIRGLPVAKALDIPNYSPNSAAALLKKACESAIANAEHNEGADIDELKVAKAMVVEGPTVKASKARAKVRADGTVSGTSHLPGVVSE